MANLRGYIDDSITTIQVDDTTSFPTNGGVVEIEDELIRYTTATDKAILGCERGFNSTTPVAHEDKSPLVIQATTKPLYKLQEYEGSGAPTDHLTGIGFAFKGTRYTDTDNAAMYINNGDETDPVWQPFAEGSSSGASGPNGAIQLSDGAGNLINDPAAFFTTDNGYPTIVVGDGTANTPQFSVLTPDSGGLGIYEPNYAVGLGFLTATATPDNVLTLATDHGSIDINAVNTTPGPAILSMTSDNFTVDSGETFGGVNTVRVLGTDGGAAFITLNSDLESDIRFYDQSGSALCGVLEADVTVNRMTLESRSGDIKFIHNGNESVFGGDGSINLPGNGVHLNNTGPGTILELRASNSSFFELSNDDGSSTYGTIKAGDDTSGNLIVEANTGVLQLTSDTAVINMTSGGNSATWDGTNFDIVNAADARLRLFGAVPTVRFHDGDGDIKANIEYFNDTLIMEMTDLHVSINDLNDDGAASPCAILHLRSETKGFLPPSLNTTQRDAISDPSAGLMIFNTTTQKLNVFTSAWEVITSV